MAKGLPRSLKKLYRTIEAPGVVGTGAEIETGVAALRKEVIVLTNRTIALTDEAGVVAFAGSKILDLAEGLITFQGAVMDLALTKDAAGVNDDWDGDVSLGTVTASNNATLTGTEADLVVSLPANVLSPAELSARAAKEFHEELLKGWHTMRAFEKGRRYAAALSLSGRHQEALSVAWGLYCSARDNRHLDAACVAVAGALRARDLSLPNANRFLAFQKHGANGPDGKLGTEDDAANPLAEFRVKLPAAHEEWLKAQAHSLIENGKYRDAGYAWLHAGDARQALSAFNRVRSVCPFEAKAIDEMTRDIVAALKALHGHPLGAGPFLAFQQYGPSGKDGQPGTADDLEDSLAEF